MGRHNKDVLTRHCQQSWYIPGVIVLKIGQDVYAFQVEDNKILDRDHTQLRPRAPGPSGRAVTFEFTAGDLDSDDDGEADDYTAERILTDKPDPATPGLRLYKGRWKGFAPSRDSWEPPSSFVPRYTTVWLDYLQKKGVSLDVKDVLVHLIMHERNSVSLPSPLTRLFVFAKFAPEMHIPLLKTSQVPPIQISLT